MAEDEMAYVAADPSQPGAAWAVIVDDPKYAKDTAEEIASWILKGARVERVTIAAARAMIMKWVRPEKKKLTEDTKELF